jgi:flagella basal body P-ring formation protein FlgA
MTRRSIYGGNRVGVALLALILSSVVAHAADQDPALLQALAERFLKMQTAGLPGKMSIDVKPPRNALPACAALDAFQPAGSRALGKTIVGVRCVAPAPWTVYLSAQVSLIGPYVVTRLSLPANHVLVVEDLQLNEGDLGSLPADVLSNPVALLGYRTISGLATGAPLRTSLLRAPLAVQQGQAIRLTFNGPGFMVQTEGQALANASRGDLVRVKTASGQVVSGVAQDGQQVVVAY